MSTMQADLHVGMKALSRGLMTGSALQQAIVEHARRSERAGGAAPSFALFLVSGGFLSAEQLAGLLDGDSPSAAPFPPKAAAPPPRAAVGKFGKYTVLRELGRGSMGEVVEALDSATGRKVAIKRPFARHHAGAVTSRDEERFLVEASVAALLPKHANLVEVFEAGKIDGQCYIAMELVEGCPMSEWRMNSTLREELDALLQVAAGIHHAHEYGVIHRDLKPHNIMIRADGRAVVMDFGLAKSTTVPQSPSVTPAGFVVGSPAYMSPEQARCMKNIDRRTDIYSLGVMLYQALTGRKPFEGRSAMEMLIRMVQDPVRRPSEIMRAGLNPMLYQDLENVCLKALQREPRDRHPTAKAFADDLTRALGNHLPERAAS